MRSGNLPLATLKRLAADYYDTNGDHCEYLDKAPSALEFSRLAHISRPAVIQESPIPRPQGSFTWTKESIAKAMGDKKVSVAATPDGRADALARGPDDRVYFVEPHVQAMGMGSFLQTLSPIDGNDSTANREVYYLQSQNGNMYRQQPTNGLGEGEEDAEVSEFMPLREHIPPEIPWASEALDKPPDAVNLWIGDERSVTSIHNDPYENIYVVLRGVKHFTVLPPTEGWCLGERRYPHARYERSASPTSAELVVSPTPDPLVRWSSVTDPTLPGALPAEAHPMRLTVSAGQALYLPAGWWHHVEQEGFTVAINYWYDMEVMGMAWLWLQFLRGVDDPPLGNGVGSDAVDDGAGHNKDRQGREGNTVKDVGGGDEEGCTVIGGRVDSDMDALDLGGPRAGGVGVNGAVCRTAGVDW